MDVSNFLSCRLAVSEYSIAKAKFGSHQRASVRFFLAFANALKNVGCEVVVFQIVEAVFNHLPQIEGFRTAGLLSEKIKALFAFAERRIEVGMESILVFNVSQITSCFGNLDAPHKLA